MATNLRDLRRCTDLSRLFYLLAERKLTLLNPGRWDDRNDSYCLRRYKDAKEYKPVLALCFVQSSERYHLWKVFGAGTSGVRIKFKRKTLLKAVDKVPGLLHDEVEYFAGALDGTRAGICDSRGAGRDTRARR